MPHSKRTDLIPDIFAQCPADYANRWIIIILFEPEQANTTVEIGVFFSTEQVINRFKQDSKWLVDEKYGNSALDEIMQTGLLPARSNIPARFAYGPALEDLEQIILYYKKKTGALEKKLTETKKDGGNEPKQLTAPKDPKDRPN